MSYLEYTVKHCPRAAQDSLSELAAGLLLIAVAGVGFLMLYSVAGGSFRPGPSRR